jgi:hypothetical protein
MFSVGAMIVQYGTITNRLALSQAFLSVAAPHARKSSSS